MTHAVSYILMALAVLLFVHVLWIVLLKFKKPNLNKEHAAQNSEYLIIYATQSGNAAHLAQQTSDHLQNAGFSQRIIDIQALKREDIESSEKLLWFVSTYGEGDAPDSARVFIRELMSKPLDLHRKKFAILALGDRHYSNFCQFGYDLKNWLKQNSAVELFKLICVDHLNPQDLKLWQSQLEQLTLIHFADLTQQPEQAWNQFQLVERELLNHGSQGNPLYRIRLNYPIGMSWQSGDILEVQCENSQQRIEDFLKVYRSEIDALTQDFDQSTLRLKNLHQLPERLEQESILSWMERFETLDYREYSIATIPDLGFIELVVRQEIYQGQLGLGSGWLTMHATLNQNLQARIRSNPSFHLQDQIRPTIFIGNGSGIAGLLSHLHQCKKQGYINNWLIFGERQRQYDHAYVEQLQAWKQCGTLADLDLIYSRDGNPQRYVTDCLYQKSKQLETWVDRGAVIYVCGSLKGMAQDVDNALHDLLGESKVHELLAEKRYLRDVY